MLKVGWFSTGRGPGSRGLFQFIQQRIRAGILDASIEFVFSNRERGQAEGSDAFFALVDSYKLPLVTLSSRWFARERGGRFDEHRSALRPAGTGTAATLQSRHLRGWQATCS